MKKSYLTTLILFAAVFAILIPFWAIGKEGAATASPEEVPKEDQEAKELFATNCGSCHTLDRAGTDGVVGPNLDDLLGTVADDAREGNIGRVESAIINGVQGRMPAGILRGEAVTEVSEFTAEYAGR